MDTRETPGVHALYNEFLTSPRPRWRWPMLEFPWEIWWWHALPACHLADVAFWMGNKTGIFQRFYENGWSGTIFETPPFVRRCWEHWKAMEVMYVVWAVSWGRQKNLLFHLDGLPCAANSIQVGTETSHGLESRGAPDVSTSMWGQLERCTCPFCRLADYSERHLKYMSQTHLNQQLGNIF
jgi:hypothetical protein